MGFRYLERFGKDARLEIWPIQIAFSEDVQQEACWGTEAYWRTEAKINQAKALLPRLILCIPFLDLCS